MTIYNQVNNISDDYTFVLNTDELFYTKEEMPCGVFEYDTSNQTWTETRKTSNAFDTKYEDAKNFVKTYYQSILDIINPETKYSDLLTEVGAGNGLFIGIQMDSIKGFPQLNDNQYFITIISPSLKMCIPVKSFILYSNTRIVENNDEELNDLEYLSAKQCLNLIYNAISKVEILQIVDELPTQPSDIKTNCVYLLYEENNQSQDEIDDGLNFHFSLWVYSTTDEEFKQIDRLTFDIKNYALKNHTHGQINNNGTIGNTAGIPLITGANGIVTVGTFGSSSSTTATDFVSCADTRLSDSRTPKTHASTATTYGVGTETKYGHNKVINNLTTSSYQNGESLSAYQGKILQDNINDVISSIPVKTSDLTNDGDGTNAFLTQHQSLSNYVQKSNTTGLLKNDGSVMTGGTGSSNYAIGNHTHEYPTYEYVSSVLKIAYSVNGTATNFDVSSVWSGNMTVDTPLFVFAKNTIGDNVANATLKFKSNGSDITILNVKNYMMQPIEAGVWKKDTWALFFCHGSSTVQLQGIFYDTIAIDTLINNVSEQIENAVSNANTGTSIDVVDNLTTDNATKALSAKQGKILNDNKAPVIHSHNISDITNLDTALIDVVDNLTTDNGTKALSAKQGKILNDNKAPVIHSHDISDITNLDTALNDKADVLVSGYNIKTINSESILGSGNLTIQNEDNYYLYMDGNELVFLAAEEEQIATTAQIIWDDNNNSNGLRPSQVICTLSNGETFTLSDSNNWTTTVYRPKYVNGQGVLYTWRISSVLGYTTTSSTDNNVTTFTNTYRPQPSAPQ